MKAKYLLIAVAVSTIFSACKKKDIVSESVKEQLKLSRSRISLVNHLVDSFAVESDVNWNIKGLPEWLSALPVSGNGKGTVQLTATKNDSGVYRAAYVVVTPIGTPTLGPDTVYVSQGKSIFKVSKTAVNLAPYENSYDSVFLNTSEEWTLSYTCDWLRVETLKLSNDRHVLVLSSSKPNLSTSDREVEVKIFPNPYSSFAINTIKVVQFGERSTLQGKCFGGSNNDSALALIKTPDQNYLIAGSTNSNDGDIRGNHGGFDAWLLKFNQSGMLLWSKVYGGSRNDHFKSVANTPDGGFIAAGYSQSSDGDLSANLGGADAWVMKVDRIGNIQWNTMIGGSANDVASSIEITPDGGYIVAGHSYSKDGEFALTSGGAWIMKLDANGKKIWSRKWKGIWDSRFFSVISTAEGFVAAGWAHTKVSNFILSNSGFMVKFDKDGNQLWAKVYGGSLEDELCKVIEVDDGYIAVGFTESTDIDLYCKPDETQGGWIMKVDKSGKHMWSEKFGGFGKDAFNDVVKNNDGSFSVAGTYRSAELPIGTIASDDIWAMNIGQDGKRYNERSWILQKTDRAYAIVKRFDTGHLLAGIISIYIPNTYYKGNCDAYIRTY